MEAQEDHPSFARLWEWAAQKLGHKKPRASDVARLLGISPQALNNWRTRGVSLPQALEVEKTAGCYAVWLLEGVKPPEGEGLSKEALQIARQFDTITDPDLRQRAFTICNGTTLSMGGISMPPAVDPEPPAPPPAPRATRPPALPKRTRT